MKKNILATVLTIMSLIIAVILVFVIVGKTKNKKPTTDTTITQEIVTDYNITYVLDEGVNNPNNPSKYNKNTTYTLLDATKDGYEFIGWYLDSSHTTKVTEINSSLNGDITLYAKFEEIIDYNIAYYLYDGENNADNPTTFNRLSNYTLKPAYKEGYEFVGWFLEAGFTTQVTKLDRNLSSDIELHAKFEEIVNYNITYNLDGGTNDPDNITTFNKFTDFTLKNASKNKYEFKGWFLEDGFINQVTKIDSSFTEDIELFAKFEKIVYDYDYTITYHLDGGENNPNNPDGFFEDETIELYSATKTGYDFKGWYTSEAHTLEITTIEANMDYELYAWFELHEYSITYHNVDGLVNNNPTSYTLVDGTFNLKNVTRPRANFLGWYTTSTFGEESNITSIDSSTLKDYDLYAQFEIVPEEPTYSVNPNELTYDGTDQALLTYTVEGGTIYFSLDNETYSTEIPTGKNAGDYIVYYKIIGINEEYLDILDQNIIISISKKAIDNSNIELPNGTFTYDGDTKSLAYTGTLPEKITGVDYINNGQVNAGTYTVRLTFVYDKDNYVATKDYLEATLTINKASIDMSGVAFDNSTVTYDGNEHSILASNIPSLITNVDYTNNGQVNAGTYEITVTFDYDKDNYTATKDSLTATLTINKASIDMSGVAFDNSTVTYDGNEHSILASNIPSLITNVDYTNNGQVNAGTYEITVTFDYDKDNYTATKDSLTATLTISPASITDATVTGYKGDFDDESHNAAAEYSATTVDDSEITWLFSNDNATWVSVDELTVKNPSDSKTYYYKASAANHEDLTGTFTVKIRTIATITIVNLAALSKTYDGNYIVDPIIETNSSSTPSISYTWGPNSSAQKPVNANTYTINVQVAENEDYTACVVTGTIVISKADYTLPANLFADKTVTYTGEEFELIINGTLPSTLEVTYTNNKLTNVGSILATATFENNSDNYNDVEFMTATLTITPATITNPDVDGYNGMSDDEYHNAAVEYSANTVDGSTITWSFSNDGENWVSVDELKVKDPSDSGTYYFKASAANHNDITGSFNVVITEKMPATITISNLDELSKIYDGTPIIDPSINKNTDGEATITYSLDGENWSSEKPVNAGTYTIKVVTAETSTYAQGIITKQLTISKAIIDMSEVEFNDLTVTYDGNEHSITASNIPSLITDVTYTNNGKVNAGTYEITVTFDYDKDNYTATKDSLTKTLTINPASITDATVTGYKGDFDDESHNAAAEYSATTVDDSEITWLFSNDNATWVSVDELTVKNPSDSKTYYYKASAANHEDLTGTFTVKIRTIATITIVNLAALSKTYDGNYIVDPIIETNSSSTPSISYTWGPNSSAQKPVNANTYTINVQVAENEDYTACVVTGTIVISKADYTLPANLFADKTVTYTGEEFELIINGTLPSTLEVTYTNNKLTNVGSILATATFENNSDNYNDVEPMTATLTINKATPTTSGISVNYDEGVGSFFTTNKSTSSIEFVGTYSTAGTITYTDSRTSLEIGTLSYSYRFTPTDTHNYETIDGTVEITTKATVEYYDETTLLNTLYVAKNETATNLTLTPKAGYTANGWTLTGSTTLYDFTTLVTTNLSLTAKYTIIEYTISYELNGGTNNSNNPTSYFVTTETITLLDPSKDDANFLGWYTEDTFDNKVTQIAKGSTGNITLYAKYEEILPESITITYHLNGGTQNNGNRNYYTADTTPFDLLDPTKGSAFTFDGWYLDSEFTQRIITVNPSIMTTDFDVYAKWSALHYSIMYYYGDERITTLNPKSYTIEDTITLPTYSVYNHTFNGWYLDSDLTNQITTIDAGSTGTVKVYAKLTDNGFTVKFYDTDKTTLLDTKTTTTYGSVTAPSYSYDDHIYLLKWVDKATNELVELDNIDNNYNLYAELVVISYTANIYYVDADGYGTARTSSPIITSKTISSLTYGDNISLYRQMRVTDASAYDLFYMSPIDAFDWSLVVSSLALGTSKNASDGSCACYATTEGTAGTIRIYVFCIQPVAIITSSSQTIAFTQNLDMSTSTYQFYSTIDSAFEAFNSQSGKLMRIYGRYNGTITTNCFGADVTIAQASATVDGTTITRPKLIYKNSDITLHNNYILTSGSIILPYSRKCTDVNGYLVKQQSATAANVVCSLLIINEDVNLSLGIVLTIGAEVYGNGQGLNTVKVGGRGVILNNGTITLNTGSTIMSYGYLKGLGIVIANSGSIIKDLFTIYDWPGGTNATGLYPKNIFPFQCYSLHNVSCTIEFFYGAKYVTYYQFYMRGFYGGDIILLGDHGLFELENGYVIKSIREMESSNTNTSYTSSNNTVTVKDVLDIHGSFNDNQISVNIQGEDVSTSTTLALPVGFMEISISDGSGTLSKNSYKFLPGSLLSIGKTGSLTIASGVKVIAYENFNYNYDFSYRKTHPTIFDGSGNLDSTYLPKYTVNGTLDAKGLIAGKIYTTDNTGYLKLTNVSGSLPVASALSSGSVTTANDTIYAQIYLFNNNSFSWSNASKTTYSSIEYNDEYGFAVNNNVNTFTLTYNYLTNTNSINIYSTSDVYTLVEADLNALNIDGYSFEGWFIDQAHTIPALGCEISGNTNLYAKLTAIIYNIEYQAFIIDDYDDQSQLINNNPTSFIITDTISFVDASCGDLMFYGWFIDEDFSISAPNITSSSFAYYKLIMVGNTIHLYGYLSAVSRNSIVYRDQNGMTIDSIPSYQILNGESITLADAMPDYTSSDNIDTTLYAYELFRFSKWLIVSSTGTTIGQYNAGATYTPTTSINIIPVYTLVSKYVTINPGTLMNASYTVTFTGGSGDSNSAFVVPVGTSLKFTVTYTESNNRTFTYQPASGSSTSNTTVTANYNATVSASSEAGGCFARGTLITLADGSKKKIEDLLVTDEIMIFNHFTGKYEKGNIAAIVNHGEQLYNVMVLTFDDGTVLRLITDHGLFDIDELKYVSFTEETYSDYVGHRFLQYDPISNNNKVVTLINAEIVEEITESWSLFSVVHMNHVINNMLGVSTGLPGFSNFFEFDSDGYSYNEESMINDINVYGLYTYDDWKDYITEDIFEAFGFAYVKPNVEKGYATKEEIISFIMWFYELVENNSMWTN